MQERAIRERWPMSDKVRLAVLKRLAKIVDEETVHDGEPPGHREVIAASRALMTADKLNIEGERLEIQKAEAARKEAEAGVTDDPEAKPRIVIPGSDERP